MVKMVTQSCRRTIVMFSAFVPSISAPESCRSILKTLPSEVSLTGYNVTWPINKQEATAKLVNSGSPSKGAAMFAVLSALGNIFSSKVEQRTAPEARLYVRLDIMARYIAVTQ